jgi:glucose-1-phosphate cytidylyltransferase
MTKARIGEIMNVCIMAGGLGTRLLEETEIKPKPMVEVGGHPILWHIMNIYAAFGHKEFTLALGYKGQSIKDYFLNYYHQNCDSTIDLKSGKVEVHDGHRQDWKVHCVDTGLNTGTGGRLKKLSKWAGKKTFMMTYGDGVSDVDLNALVAFHRKTGKLATMTAVRPPARFGGLTFKGDLVTRFTEKPQIGEGWINGGFFILEPEVLNYITSEEEMFEQKPLERLAKEGQLAAYRHEGFWQCMDTVRDVRLLNGLWESGQAPWKKW